MWTGGGGAPGTWVESGRVGTRTRGDMAWLVVEAYLDGLVGDEAADPGVWVADVGVATPLYEVVGLGEWATV